jgi:threonine aldolase
MFFGSDNQSGASSQILEMIQIANTGNTHGYGDDDWTKQGIDALK